mgnify:CR=1 FL=1
MKIKKSELKEIIKEELKLQEGEGNPLDNLVEQLEGLEKFRKMLETWKGELSGTAIVKILDDHLRPAFAAAEDLRILLQQAERNWLYAKLAKKQLAKKA